MLKNSLVNLKGIGPGRAEKLGSVGLFCCEDLLFFLPRKHEDYSVLQNVSSLQHGQTAVLKLQIDRVGRTAFIRKNLNIVTVLAHDESGKISLVWYNQPYRAGSVQVGMTVFAYGRTDTSRGVKLLNPTLCDTLPGILPVYAPLPSITPKLLHSLMEQVLADAAQVNDVLPAALCEKYHLMPLAQALQEIHRPSSMQSLENAKRRFAFEDALRFFVLLQLARENHVGRPGISFHTADSLDAFLSHFPFSPTMAQRRVLEEIAADMQRATVMNRMIQGDVGSGKTLLALYALFLAARNGYQSAFMAPTEILAEQHYKSVSRLFPGRSALLIGSMKKTERRQVLAQLASGEIDVVVGTQALLQDDIVFSRLGVVIADEQHRFGVRQRAVIAAKGESPDILVMSATPIPRSLALILYGDLELSVLDEMPPGRKKIETHFVPQKKRDALYGYLEAEARQGRQAYVVCPLIEQAEGVQALSAVEVYEELRQKLNVPVGLLTGQMGGSEKTAVLEQFRKGCLSVLVSTTVIEVGIDVPNACIMVIEGADRFGLSQLHQLRGRVGRGDVQSYCFLLSESESVLAAKRLKILTQTSDGFVIAQADLELRGPGEFLGARQHGMGMFEAIRNAYDMDLIHEARNAASDMLALRDAAPAFFAKVEKEAERYATIAMN